MSAPRSFAEHLRFRLCKEAAPYAGRPLCSADDSLSPMREEPHRGLARSEQRYSWNKPPYFTEEGSASRRVTNE